MLRVSRDDAQPAGLSFPTGDTTVFPSCRGFVRLCGVCKAVWGGTSRPRQAEENAKALCQPRSAMQHEEAGL